MLQTKPYDAKDLLRTEVERAICAGHPVAIERQVVVRDRMKITMSCDHRVIDGAAGAQYLQTLRQFLEQPIRVIL